jgi:hypothetical protein
MIVMHHVHNVLIILHTAHLVLEKAHSFTIINALVHAQLIFINREVLALLVNCHV